MEMATIVNNPPAVESGNNTGMILGIILLLVLAFVLIFYGIPYFTNATRSTTPTVSVPDQIDVNVQTPDASQN